MSVWQMFHQRPADETYTVLAKLLSLHSKGTLHHYLHHTCHIKHVIKALAHYKDFHKDFSGKIVVKIFVHIQNC